jgi:hypothetical protein
MRKKVLTALGVSLVTAFTTQLATAAASSTRTPARATVAVNQQFRNANGSADLPQGRRPSASGSKSCDIFWCYEN